MIPRAFGYVGRLAQVRNLQIVHALQVGEDLLDVTQKLRENFVHVSGTLQDVAQNDMQIRQQGVRLHAVPSEAD